METPLVWKKDALLSTQLPNYVLVNRGKVRDIYELDSKRLLIVATDRISAFDVVLKSGIPDKGCIITALSIFWFNRLQSLCRHHLLNSDIHTLNGQQDLQGLAQRSMIVTKYQVLPIEAIVRGYLAGSAWKEYKEHGTVHGIPLPPDLQKGDALITPLFTPSTKATSGNHDVNLHPNQVVQLIGEKHAREMEHLSLLLYKEASAYALKQGIIIADTKFEFAVDENDQLVLVDEILTPDSSRFWLSESTEDRTSSGMDKQYIRDWLEEHDQVGKEDVVLPDLLIQRTREKYIQVKTLFV